MKDKIPYTGRYSQYLHTLPGRGKVYKKLLTYMALHQMVIGIWMSAVHVLQDVCLLKVWSQEYLLGHWKGANVLKKIGLRAAKKNPATIKIITCGGKISPRRSCGEREKDEHHHHTHSGGISGEPNYPIEKGDYSFFVIFVPSETPLPWEIFTLLSISCLH